MNMDFLKEQPYFLDVWKENVTAEPDRLFLTDEMQPQGMTRREADELSAKVYAWLKKQETGRPDHQRFPEVHHGSYCQKTWRSLYCIRLRSGGRGLC